MLRSQLSEYSFDKAFAARHDFTFPYVIDTTQEVSRAYDDFPSGLSGASHSLGILRIKPRR